jgi:hypothetical protein
MQKFFLNAWQYCTNLIVHGSKSYAVCLDAGHGHWPYKDVSPFVHVLHHSIPNPSCFVNLAASHEAHPVFPPSPSQEISTRPSRVFFYPLPASGKRGTRFRRRGPPRTAYTFGFHRMRAHLNAG